MSGGSTTLTTIFTGDDLSTTITTWETSPSGVRKVSHGLDKGLLGSFHGTFLIRSSIIGREVLSVTTEKVDFIFIYFLFVFSLFVFLFIVIVG